MRSTPKGILSPHFLIPNVLLLIVVAFAVDFVYKSWVIPRVEVLQAEKRVMAGLNPAGGQSLFIIIKDPEQQYEIAFFIWGVLFLGWKTYQIACERKLLQRDFMTLQKGERIIPEHASQRQMELKTALEAERGLSERILPKCLTAALHRFNASGSIQDAATAVRDVADRSADDLDSSLSLIRYIAWAIPALGFIGTVRGIGAALAHVQEAINGDLSVVTDNLGLAFNSTLVALIISMFLLFILHAVQSSLEGLISEVQTYCDEKVIDVMRVPAAAGDAHPQSWDVETKAL